MALRAYHHDSQPSIEMVRESISLSCFGFVIEVRHCGYAWEAVPQRGSLTCMRLTAAAPFGERIGALP